MEPTDPPSAPPAFSDLTAVPSWLSLPPNAEPPPPVETRTYPLPIGQLTWDNFERLCVRLAELEADVEYCRQYGVRGQDQEGIDLFAWERARNSYTVYQCKRVKDFGPADMRSAVATFLGGSWAGKAKRFVLCSTADLNVTTISNEIDRQRAILHGRDVALDIWDIDGLSKRLREHARIVDDFFGRPWVRLFLGEDVAQALRPRLDASEVLTLRAQLRDLYRAVFVEHDPGIPATAQDGVPIVALADRYVLPDVLVTRERGVTHARGRASADERALVRGPADMVADIEPAQPGAGRLTSAQTREPAFQWLAESERSLILGAPGSGKSSLLRYLCLDLLDDQPQLGNPWVQRLPVWLPFALWTKLISASPESDVSLEHCLHYWFHGNGNEALWPLVEQAMRDERLLLLVDGLDEWTSEPAARVAWQLLQIHVRNSNGAVVATSRPYGYERLRAFGTADWQRADLAPLSLSQRRTLCETWYGIVVQQRVVSVSSEHEPALNAQAKSWSRRFLQELARNPDLDRMAETPLLLLLLLAVRFQRGALPDRRFLAYEQIIEHIIAQRPAAKMAAALVVPESSDLSTRDISDVFAYLAFAVQTTQPDGIIDVATLRGSTESYLRSDLGLGNAEARRTAERFLLLAERVIGLVVREGDTSMRFLHRTFQEFLAARYLSRLTFTTQLEIVEQRATDPAWREVMLALCWHTNRRDELEELLRSFERFATEDNAGLAVREWMTEIAFGDFKTSPESARDLADTAIRRIETHAWMPHRRRLLRAVLDGLGSTRLRDVARTYVRRWVYCREGLRQRWYSSMRGWPNEPDVVSLLLTVLQDESADVQRAAGNALAVVGASDQSVGDAVAHIALRSPDPLARAAALESLGGGWAQHHDVQLALQIALKSPSPELRLAGIAYHVGIGSQTEADFEQLLELASDNGRFELAYGWQPALKQSLIDGWRGNPRLKDVCLRTARAVQFDEREIRIEIAFDVLLTAFPQDQQVAEFCAEQLQQQHPFLGSSHLNQFSQIAQSFRDNPTLVAAIDAWGPTQDFHQVEVCFAALVGRTDTMKAKLLADLSGSFPHWPAFGLLEGWGMQDPQVAEALIAMATGPAARASSIGHLLPRILDREAASARLLSLLADAENVRPDFVIQGLATIGPDDNADVATKCLDCVRGRGIGLDDQSVSAIVTGFPRVAAVRDFAMEALPKRGAPIAAIADAYSDLDARTMIAETTTPLHPILRRDIINDLANSPDESFNHAILRDYDLEENDELKVAASIGFHRGLNTSDAESEKVLQGLSLSIRAYGFDFAKRRRAAFAGLLILDRLDIMVPMTERHGDHRLVGIELSDPFGTNNPLIELVGEYWTRIRVVFGESVETRLTHLRSHGLWEGLCNAGVEHADLARDAANAIRQDSNLAAQPSALRFLARLRPRSPELRDACVMALQGSVRFDAFDSVRTSVDILAEQFHDDQELVEIVKARYGLTLRHEGAALAICAVAPESAQASKLFSQLESPDRPPMHFDALFGVLYAGLPAARISQQIAHDVNTQPRHALRFMLKPLVRRLRNDEGAALGIAEELLATQSTSKKASLSTLLAAAGRLSPDLRTTCHAYLEDQLRPEVIPELGYDLVSDRVRGLSVALLDALGAET